MATDGKGRQERQTFFASDLPAEKGASPEGDEGLSGLIVWLLFRAKRVGEKKKN